MVQETLCLGLHWMALGHNVYEANEGRDWCKMDYCPLDFNKTQLPSWKFWLYNVILPSYSPYTTGEILLVFINLSTDFEVICWSHWTNTKKFIWHVDIHIEAGFLGFFHIQLRVTENYRVWLILPWSQSHVSDWLYLFPITLTGDSLRWPVHMFMPVL